MKQSSQAVIAMAHAIAGVIRELGSVPSGHLYARLMGQLTLEQYQAIIDVLADAKLVSVKNHLITWKGGK